MGTFGPALTTRSTVGVLPHRGAPRRVGRQDRPLGPRVLPGGDLADVEPVVLKRPDRDGLGQAHHVGHVDVRTAQRTHEEEGDDTERDEEHDEEHDEPADPAAAFLLLDVGVGIGPAVERDDLGLPGRHDGFGGVVRAERAHHAGRGRVDGLDRPPFGEAQQVGPQLLGRGVTVGGVLRQRLHHHGLERGGHRRVGHPRQHRMVAHVLGGHRDRGVPGERWSTHRHFVEDDTEAVDVAARVDTLSFGLLG